ARGPDEFSEAMAVARELDTELEKAMEFKFGSLPGDAVDRLQAASSAELSVWTERILSDDSLEELLNKRPPGG
ncbi:MAG: hypothetical protein AAFQ65_11300, partial [Myxococcota bacterium]